MTLAIGILVVLFLFAAQRANDNIAVRSPTRRQEAGRVSFVFFVLMCGVAAMVALMAMGVQP